MKCKKCQSENLIMRTNAKNPNATEVICGDCGAWQKFIGKDEIRLFEIRTSAQPKIPTNADRMGAMLVVGKGYILSAPTADVAPVRRGEWGQSSAFDEDENVYTCSSCGEPWVLIDGTPPENNMNFCPNCGARMDGEKHE